MSDVTFRIVPGAGKCCMAMAEFHGVGRQCVLYAGHTGPHSGYSSASRVTWTDNDSRFDGYYGDPARTPEADRDK